LSLVGLDIDNEDEGVVLLNLLHRTLGVKGVDDDLVLIETRLVRDGLARVLGGARELEGLGAVEGGRETDFADLVRVHLFLSSAPLRLQSSMRDGMETYALQSRLRGSAGLLGAFAWLSSTCNHLRISNRS
jgi:hypothetical protein